MALQSSGTISLNDVNVELGNSGTASINMGSSDVRGLFGVASGTISMSDGYGASSGNIHGSRVLVATGYSSSWTTDVEYYNTTGGSIGTPAAFGSMLSSYVNGQPLATTNGSRALFSAGSNTTVGTGYFTVSTTGNATFFGNLTYNRTTGAACTNISRGVFIAGSFTQIMDYHTISTTGNAVTFGTFSDRNTFYPEGTQSYAGRGIIAGGFPNPGDNKILYITIATTGNTTAFGTLTVATWNFAAGSNGTRAIWAGGQNAANGNASVSRIMYNTIATTGNAATFGTLVSSLSAVSGGSNGTHFFINGGATTIGTRVKYIQVVNVSTTGNATQIGNLTKVRSNSAATSGD